MVKNIFVRKHKRRGRIVRRHTRSIPQKKGSLWHGKKFIHGPRITMPAEYELIWISKENWPRKKWLTKKQQKKIRDYAKKQKLKLPKNFPQSTRVKVGITKKRKMKPQSFLTPINLSFAPFGPRKKGYISIPLPAGTPLEFTEEEKKRFEIKKEKNLGSWTDLGLISPWKETKIKEKEELLKKKLPLSTRLKLIEEKERLEKLE